MDVDLVLLEVHVHDRAGRPVYSLAAGDFRVYEDGVRQEVAVFELERDQPVSLAVLIDNSRGMTDAPLRAGKAAVRQLIHLLRPEDEVLLASYHKDFFLEQTFTTDRAELMDALDNIYPRGRGGPAAGWLGAVMGSEPAYTGLAVDLALRELRSRPNARRVVLAISNRFTGVGPATTDHVRTAEVPVYALSFCNAGWTILSLGGDRMALKDIVAESGGTTYGAGAPDLPHNLRRLAEGFKTFYHIGYYPAPRAETSKPRKIRVETLDKGLTVRTRRSYVPAAKPGSGR